MDNQPIYEKVIADIKERDRIGYEQHHKPLTAADQRDAHWISPSTYDWRSKDAVQWLLSL